MNYRMLRCLQCGHLYDLNQNKDCPYCASARQRVKKAKRKTRLKIIRKLSLIVGLSIAAVFVVFLLLGAISISFKPFDISFHADFFENGHTHTFAKEFSGNENYHWHE